MSGKQKDTIMKKERTELEELNRSMYDFRYEEEGFYRVKEGLTKDIVLEISREKHDPSWMTDFRLKSLEIYNKLKVPDWGPDISGLNIDDIVTYVRPNTDMKGSWEEVPEDIKNTFERLGIPQAERESLAGVGAQYDSERFSLIPFHVFRSERISFRVYQSSGLTP